MPIIHDPPLDDRTPIDRSKVGELGISLPLLRELLRLPTSLEVVGADFDEMHQELRLRLAGEPMPALAACGAAERVHVICTMQTRKDGKHRITAHFLHAPQERWILRDWHHG